MRSCSTPAQPAATARVRWPTCRSANAARLSHCNVTLNNCQINNLGYLSNNGKPNHQRGAHVASSASTTARSTASAAWNTTTPTAICSIAATTPFMPTTPFSPPFPTHGHPITATAISTDSTTPTTFSGVNRTFDTNGYVWSYCLPTNSAFIDAGNMPAVSLGFYHWTTQTNQAPETNTIVDLGYHYVAVDTNSNPIDSSIAVCRITFSPRMAPVLPYLGYITNGLAAYWKLDDQSGTNAADSSGNGVTMPLYGSPSWGSNYLI